MKGKSVFSLAASLFAFAVQGALPASFQIGQVIYAHVLTLPAPTGWWGSEPKVPRVVATWRHALLDFGSMRGPQGGTLPPYPHYTVVEHLQGVRDIDGAKAHFKLAHGIDLDEAIRENGARPRDLEDRVYPYGHVLIVDLGRIGWAPGNRYYYFFFDARPRAQTIYMGPTHYMDYDLSRVRLERVKPAQ